MKVREFENTVWDVEGIRIVVRAAGNEEVKCYHYANAAPATHTLRKLLDNRITNLVDDKEVVAINGRGHVVVRSTQLRTIKRSYEAAS